MLLVSLLRAAWNVSPRVERVALRLVLVRVRSCKVLRLVTLMQGAFRATCAVVAVRATWVIPVQHVNRAVGTLRVACTVAAPYAVRSQDSSATSRTSRMLYGVSRTCNSRNVRMC